jgi:hypothetical protein
MPFAPFFEKFRDVAEAETRAVIVFDDPVLPPGRYPFVEFYCNEPGCDCRRVMFQVMREDTRTLEAEIGFGWEDRPYYVEWMGDDEPDVIDAMIGPAFNIGGPITEYSDVLLEHVREAVRDPAYVDRLKRHYTMYRATIDPPSDAIGARRGAPKTGRNEPCPCGSGKKFKRCCGR